MPRQGQLVRQMSTAVRTNYEYREASAKVAYELQMLVQTACILHAEVDSRSTNGAQAVIHNALIHAFLLGVRNLYEFFWRGDRDGIHARDFMEPERWTHKQPKFQKSKHWSPVDEAKAPSEGEDLMKLIHTRLAHFSWKRVSEGKICWMVDQIAPEFVEPLQVFVNKVAPDRLSPDFLGAVEELEEAVRGFRRGPVSPVPPSA